MFLEGEQREITVPGSRKKVQYDPLQRTGDATLIDGVPNGLAWLTSGSSRQIVKLQTGSLAIYAFAMLIGVVVLIGILTICR